MKRFVLAGVLASLLVCLAACAGGRVPATGMPPGQPLATTSPTATPSPSPDFRLLNVIAADGTELMTVFYPPQDGPAPGVLLLHMDGGRKEDWASFATRLQQAGYAAMALDLRGHGDSGGEVDWETGPDDVARAWAELVEQPDVGGSRTAVIGADIGANLALVVAADEPDVQAVVLLSPGLDYHGIRTEGAMRAYGERPVLIVASEEDYYAAQAARTLAGLAQEPPVLTLYPAAGHGLEMFDSQPGLADLIMGWLRARL